MPVLRDAEATPPATETVPTSAPAPLALRDRQLAPDLARGLMLVLIAVANVWGYLYGRPTGYGHRPVDGSVVDHVVDFVVALMVDDRARPLFAILYGYGLATMATRATARGADVKSVRRLLRRRSWWLVAWGMLHATLLFSGDILAPYGATGLVVLMLVGRRPAVLQRWFWVSLATGLTAYVLIAAMESAASDAVGTETTTSYLESAVERLLGSVASTTATGLFLVFVAPAVLGIVVARAGWLARPSDHVVVMRRVLVAALVANLVGNLPHALAVAGVWEPDTRTRLGLELVHQATGLAMGLGYLCLFALLAERIGRRSTTRPVPGVVRAVAAVGQRSLTCYLLQSVMLAPLLSAWALGLGGRIGTATATALAVAVWAVTVGVAALLDRAGRRGPFEVLLRRLTYGRAAAPGGIPAGAAAPVTR